MFPEHTPKKGKAKDEIPEVKQLIIPRTHDSHMHETVHKFYFPYHKITMASLRLLYVLSHSLSRSPSAHGGFQLFVRTCMYDDGMNGSREAKRNVNGKVLCTLEGGFRFPFTVRRMLYVHINFPTPCSVPIRHYCCC